MSKGFDKLERASANVPRVRTSDFARVSENDVNVCDWGSQHVSWITVLNLVQLSGIQHIGFFYQE